MPGDEVHEGAGAPKEGASGSARAKTGPRHAAPKKPLLTRLHMPAGKAIAIAAMPSAVLMGMGLTPQLASAKPMPKNPFKDGPCVSKADKAEEEAEEKESEREQKEKIKELAALKKAAEEKAEQARAEAGDKGGDGASDDSDSSPTDPGDSGDSDGGSSGGDQDSGKGGGEDGKEADEPENPLDPLGLGDKLKDLLTPEEKKEQEKEDEKDEKGEKEKQSEDSSADSSGSSDSSDSSGSQKKADSPQDAVGKTAEETAKKAEEIAEKAEKRLKEAKEALEDSDSDKGEDGKAGEGDKGGEDGKGGGEDAAAGSGEEGKKPFPCVEEKKVKGDDEQTPVSVANRPWRLESTKLALHGLDYKGVVNLTMPNGEKKQALKFTADSVDIDDLHQIVEGPAGKKSHVKAAKGSTSTIRGGTVTMYTEELKGNLFGLIPVTFDPEHPPPLNVPEAVFTDVSVKQAGQFGGDLTVPGLQQSISDE